MYNYNKTYQAVPVSRQKPKTQNQNAVDKTKNPKRVFVSCFICPINQQNQNAFGSF